jgi:hypothetical protein
MSSSAPLTREQVKNLKPNQVHETLGRKLLVDGFDVVPPPRLLFPLRLVGLVPASPSGMLAMPGV